MQPDPRTGLFSSRLVPQQPSEQPKSTGRRLKETDPLVFVREFLPAPKRENKLVPACDVELAFRHGMWIADRDAVRAALVRANVPAARLERFDNCGAHCVVEYSPSAERYRVRASYCGDRFCLPCSTARAKKTMARMLDWTQGCRVRFVTLTLKRSDQPLKSVLDRLLKAFKKLRRQEFWLRAVKAGTAVVEITRGAARDHWHVHLHVLTVGTWLPVDELRAGWEIASEGSTVVDVRLIRDHQVGVAYVAKYAGKGWDQSVLEDADALLESVVALRGRRLLVNFGEWYDRDDQLCKAQPTDWKFIGRIRFVYEDALAGKPWGIGVLRALGYACGQVNGRPVFVGAALPWSGP